MPLPTIDAYQNTGPATPPLMGPEEMAAARTTLAELQNVGVDYDDVVEVLEREGVDKFVQAWRAPLDVQPHWQTLRLAWADFSPYRLQGVLGAARIRRIGLLAIGTPGFAELCLGRLAVW